MNGTRGPRATSNTKPIGSPSFEITANVAVSVDNREYFNRPSEKEITSSTGYCDL